MTEVDDQSAAGLNDALDRFTRRVEQVRATLFASPHFCDDVARAEAVRYLKSMEALATTTAMYYSDPRFPRFHNSCAAEWDSKYPNPDTYYLTAKVSGDYDYRITGRLGTAVQTTIGSYAYAKNAHTGAGSAPPTEASRPMPTATSRCC
nr:hypothetical protein [Nocardioides alcanivorans]